MNIYYKHSFDSTQEIDCHRWTETIHQYYEDFKMGKNLAYVSNGALYIEAAITHNIKEWANEAAYYDLEKNSCSAPTGKSCRQYTQMVWETAVKVTNKQM